MSDLCQRVSLLNALNKCYKGSLYFSSIPSLDHTEKKKKHKDENSKLTWKVLRNHESKFTLETLWFLWSFKQDTILKFKGRVLVLKGEHFQT